MNWPGEERNMLVHAFTNNFQLAKWFQISGSFEKSASDPNQSRNCLDSPDSKYPLSVTPNSSNYSLSMISWTCKHGGCTDPPKSQTFI
jgi:hypothetical protein